MPSPQGASHAFTIHLELNATKWQQQQQQQQQLQIATYS
jgi:hypothetical protein